DPPKAILGRARGGTVERLTPPAHTKRDEGTGARSREPAVAVGLESGRGARAAAPAGMAAGAATRPTVVVALRKRATAKLSEPFTVAYPAVTIFPSDWTATPCASSASPALKERMARPPSPKPVSGLPSALKRARRVSAVGLELSEFPQTRIRPSAW